MNYLKIGRLPKEETISILERVVALYQGKPYEWIWFDSYLQTYFDRMFENTELKIACNPVRKCRVQKAFWSDSGHGFGIHKDGVTDKVAMNIVLSCNPTDWVRWYDEGFDAEAARTTTGGYTRNVSLTDYESVRPRQEVTGQQIGDVYLVNTDVWHSFKCNGPLPRVIAQTKFEGNPSLEEVALPLQNKSFRSIIKE